MPLWQKNYFEIETIEKQQTPKIDLCPSSICLKRDLEFYTPETPTSSEIRKESTQQTY